MSGRYEKDVKVEKIVKTKLENLPPIVTDYYYSLLSAGKTHRTTQTYIDHIEKFIKFTFKENCKNDFYVSITSNTINRYMASLKTKTVGGKVVKISDSHKTGAWSALNSFFQFLVPDYIDNNPVAKTTRPKMKDNPEVTFLTQEEITRVLDNVKAKANVRMVNRDLCLLKIGFAVGLRVSEIVQIDIDDIDFKRNIIKITGKGDKNYPVIIGENLKNQIQLWLDDRNKYFGDVDSNALFVSQEGKRISTRTMKDLLDKYCDVVDKHVTPHVMRHSCATNLYEQTGDIYLCAGQLHHSNVTTTQRYAELSNKKREQAANLLDKIIK